MGASTSHYLPDWEGGVRSHPAKQVSATLFISVENGSYCQKCQNNHYSPLAVRADALQLYAMSRLERNGTENLKTTSASIVYL